MEVEDIIRNLKQGDKEAWNMIVNKYSNKIYNLALNFSGNNDDASDITQDIFLKLYNNIDKFKEDNNFNAWITRLSKNHCIDYWRKNKKNKYKVELDEKILSDGYTPEDVAFKKHNIVDLRKKLLRLDPELRSLIIMRDIQEYSYHEISQSLDIPLGTTKSRINRARSKLAKIFLAEEGKNGM